MTINDVKKAYLEIYGGMIFSREFSSFDDAFKAAWDSFDLVANADTPEEYAQGMTECWQLQDS